MMKTALAMVMPEMTMQLAAGRMMTTTCETVVEVESVLPNSEIWRNCQTLALCPALIIPRRELWCQRWEWKDAMKIRKPLVTTNHQCHHFHRPGRRQR